MRTVEIPTFQHVVVHYEIAEPFSRILAAFLDLLGAMFLYVILLLLFSHLFALTFLPGSYLLFPSWLLTYVSYCILSDVWNAGQTPGKWLVGIRVIRLDGRPIRWSDAFVRAMLLLLEGLFSAGLVGISLLIGNALSQRLGDIAAHTAVVKERNQRTVYLSTLLNIATTANYPIKYPQVQQLHEKDVLLIKFTLGQVRKYPNSAHRLAAARLAKRIADLLHISLPQESDPEEFLEAILREYVVLTR
ncbi:MAG: RDD family protein [Saprospiraceae bacterium]|nr:RDD family protein [Saprospiraceae bacterium]MDW8483440.1 RDD family protein [Saprospiraceae bacterium]